MNQVIRQAFRELLQGQGTNGYTEEHLGDWWEAYQEIASLAQDDLDAAKRVAGSNREIVRLMSSGPQPSQESTPTSIPDLPDEARAVYDHLGACPWFDNTVDFLVEAAPMTPRSFHEAAALFMESMAIARRLVLRVGTATFYPNLYFLFLAPSTVYKKTTGMKVVEQIVQQSGISHLLIPNRLTPEALVNDLDSLKEIPKRCSSEERRFLLNRRAFAAQRGYMRDEVSSLFASLKREFQSGLLELILEMYECPARLDEMTISRGDKVIQDSYLTFFGASTPAEMSQHFANTTLWNNGLWARFALIVPDKEPQWVFFPDVTDGIDTVARGLREVYDLFPMPTATDDPEAGIIFHPVKPEHAHLGARVMQAWESYAKATSHDMVAPGCDLPEELRVSYGRFGAMALKVAMLLATLDTEQLPVRITLRHFARAQQLVEKWRGSLHQVWSEQSKSENISKTERVLKLLSEKRWANGMTAREIRQYAPLRDSLMTDDIIRMLVDDGLIYSEKVGRRSVWKLAR